MANLVILPAFERLEVPSDGMGLFLLGCFWIDFRGLFHHIVFQSPDGFGDGLATVDRLFLLGYRELNDPGKNKAPDHDEPEHTHRFLLGLTEQLSGRLTREGR
jgi:hypothetical protein